MARISLVRESRWAGGGAHVDKTTEADARVQRIRAGGTPGLERNRSRGTVTCQKDDGQDHRRCGQARDPGFRTA